MINRVFLIFLLFSGYQMPGQTTYCFKCKTGPALLALASGSLDGFNQMVSHHYHDFKKIFPGANDIFFDPQISWRNKYEFDQSGNIAGPAFPGSKNIFVWTTDFYHLTRTSKRWTGIASLSLILTNDRLKYKRQNTKKPFFHYIYDILIFSLAETIGFNLIYHVLPKI